MATGKKRQLSRLSSSYIAVGVALITLTAILGTSVFLRAKEIRIDGNKLYSADEIVTASGLSTGDNLLFVNSQKVSANIRDELPFVSAAKITRKLPDIILIELTESPAVGKVMFSGEMYIIDSEGRVLAGSSGGMIALHGIDFDDLIEIRGLEIDEAIVGRTLKPDFGADTKLMNMQDVLAAMEREDLVDDVSYLDVSNSNNLHFGYLNRFRVVLGERRNLRQKMELLESSVEQITSRYPNTPGDINMAEVTDASSEVKFRPNQ